MAERDQRREDGSVFGSGLREAWRELQGRDVDWGGRGRADGFEGHGGGFPGDYSGDSGFGSGLGFGVGGRGHGTSGSGTGTGYGGGYGANSRYGEDEQGREVWSEGPHTGRGPQGYKGRSDERIQEDVSEALTRHGQVDARGIIVRVENGEVTLEGVANSRQEKRLAVRAIEDLPGVKDVHNRLRIGGEPGGEGSDATRSRGAEAAGNRLDGITGAQGVYMGGAQTDNQPSGASQGSGEGPRRSRKGVGTT